MRGVVMKRLASIAECVGFISILVGGAAMDSANIIPPIAVILTGCVLLIAGASMEGAI